MFEQLVHAIEKLAVDAAKPQALAVGDQRNATFAVGGGIETFEIPKPPRAHALGSVADLLAFAELHATEEARIFFGQTDVLLVLDGDGHRLERVHVELTHSKAWTRLAALDAPPSGEWLDQKKFCRLLSIELAGALPPGVLYDRVKRVSFDNGSTVTGDIKRNQQESLGRNITAKASGEGEIPETVTLVVPVYATHGQRATYPVTCSVEVDPARGLFCLAPLPDELSRVQSLALESIREQLSEGKVPAFRGTP